MRTILFKGKRNDNGEWVEGDLVHLNDGCFIITESNLIEDDGLPNGHDLVYSDPEFHAIDPTTVCQYTGQTDKNKTNVFEHDRVKHPIRGIGIIKWDDLLSCYYIAFEDRVSRFSLEKINEYEIIGNIHDKK